MGKIKSKKSCHHLKAVSLVDDVNHAGTSFCLNEFNRNEAISTKSAHPVALNDNLFSGVKIDIGLLKTQEVHTLIDHDKLKSQAKETPKHMAAWKPIKKKEKMKKRREEFLKKLQGTWEVKKNKKIKISKTQDARDFMLSLPDNLSLNAKDLQEASEMNSSNLATNLIDKISPLHCVNNEIKIKKRPERKNRNKQRLDDIERFKLVFERGSSYNHQQMIFDNMKLNSL